MIVNESPELLILERFVIVPEFNVIPPAPFVNVAPVTVPDAVTLVAPLIAPVFVIPPSVLSIDLVTTSPSASTLNPVIVIVPIVKSPEPSIDVAPLIAPDERVNVPSVMDELVANLTKLNNPEFGLYVRPVSVSIACPPVAPSTKVKYVVSLLVLFAETVTFVAVVAVVAFPEQLEEEPANVPANVVVVNLPVEGL